MKTKKGLIAGVGLTSISICAVTICALFMGNKNDLVYAKADEIHSGYHYAANYATEQGTGNAEFYSCCIHHEIFSPDSDEAKATYNIFVDQDISQFVPGAASYDNYKYYYVTLYANGGTAGSSYINNALKDKVLPDVTIPTYADHHFLGYFDANVGGTQYIDADGKGVTVWDKTENNSILYARWEKDDFVTSKTGYSANVDYSHMNDDDPYLQSNAINTTPNFDNSHAFAMFNLKDTRYYAEATVKLLVATNDSWTRFGIGSATDDTDGHARAFFFSDKDDQKTVMMDVPNEWGAVTAQSMIYQANGINKIDKSNVKLAILRDGNKYYYLMNDKLYWYEESSKFNETATYPTIIAKDTQIKITEWSASTDETLINNKLQSDAYKQVFFNADPHGRVNFVSDNEFSLSNRDSDCWFQNISVKPLGDKALLKGDFTVSFDLSNVSCSDDHNCIVGVALRKVAIESPYQADLFAMNNNCNNDEYKGHAFNYRNFKWNGGENSMYQCTEGMVYDNSSDTVEGHYVISRTIDNGTATLKLTFNDQVKLTITTSYVDDYHPIFGAHECNGTFKNVKFTSGN